MPTASVIKHFVAVAKRYTSATQQVASAAPQEVYVLGFLSLSILKSELLCDKHNMYCTSNTMYVIMLIVLLPKIMVCEVIY